MVRGLMSDEEWAFFAPFVIETGPRRGRRPRDHRLVLDGVFWIARTGAQWRDLHDHFGKWGSVYRQFRRWTLSGVWDVMLAALNEAIWRTQSTDFWVSFKLFGFTALTFAFAALQYPLLMRHAIPGPESDAADEAAAETAIKPAAAARENS